MALFDNRFYGVVKTDGDFMDGQATRKDVRIRFENVKDKAALWTPTQDERFAMAISAQSGCAGAAIWRRRSGETLEKMVTRFPYWLCRNAWKPVNNEDDLPVDQHMLLACIAPRPVYISYARAGTPSRRTTGSGSWTSQTTISRSRWLIWLRDTGNCGM